jgi:RNA-directed DNA polymerase
MLFLRDNPKVLKALLEQGENGVAYQFGGNNVFSFALPIPKDRDGYENISIEMYYPDSVISQKTEEGKRLFFDNELVMKKLISGNEIEVNPIEPKIEKELTKKVYSKDAENIKDASGNQIGLSKTAFAELILVEQKPFENIDFRSFQAIADVIEFIIKTRQ